MPFCDNCGYKLEDGTNYCPNCGSAISQKRQPRSSQPKLSRLADAQPQEQSTEDSVRRGMTNAKFNEEMSDIFYWEIAIIAIAIGYATKSWWWGGGTFLGLLFLSMIPSIGVIMCYLFGAAWGVIGYYLGDLLFGNDAAWVIGIIAALCGIGVNLAGRQYFEDLGT